MLDHLFKGGTVVDGTGAAAVRADVGVREGRIVAVGEVDEPARNVIDATGLIVAPGFIDPHTHYDAQLFWDPFATPSNLHGVTSVLAGNCGFTLAPLSEADADYTRRMMAKVEGMPLEALEQGADWQWSSFGSYLDRLEGNVGLNVGVLVGHCAIRRAVMGEASLGEAATPEQVEAMGRLLAESIAAGGLGLSTTRSFTHSDMEGEAVASRWATPEELLALCEVVGQAPGTTLELVTDGALRGFRDDEVELMAAMSVAADRPVNWNVLTIDAADPDRYRNQLGASTYAAERGGRVVALTMPVLVGMNMSFRTYSALFQLPGWSEVVSLPVPERIDRLRDPEVRRALERGAARPEAGVFSRLTGWADYVIGDTYSTANEGLKGRRVGDIAAERGQGAFDTLVEIVVNDELQTVLWPAPTDDDDASWALRAQAWESPHTLLGGSDAGAHLDRMCGAPYVTQFLADVLRGRRLTTLERAIQMVTDDPARLFGLRDRGRIAVGAHADLVAFDPATVDVGEVHLRNDLPGGARRLYAEPVGVHHVLVNGIPTVADGQPTEALAGSVLRSGADTDTVSAAATTSRG